MSSPLESLCAQLSNFSVCRNLRQEHLRRIAALLKVHKIMAGKILFHEGDLGENFYFLLEGKMQISQRITMLSDETETEIREKCLLVLSAESHPSFGEMAILNRHPRSATVSALEDCELRGLSHTDFKSLVRDDPDLGVQLLLNLSEIICTNLETANHNILKLTTALSLALR